MEIPDIQLDNIHLGNTQQPGIRRRLLSFHEGKFILRIDNSGLEDLVMCAFQGKVKKVLGRVPPTNAALVYGSAVHAGLEYHYKNYETRKTDEHIMGMAEEATKEFQNFTPALDEWRTLDRCIDTLQRYLKKYPEEPFSIIGVDDVPQVEIPFSIPLGVIELNETLAFDWETLVEPDTWPDHIKGDEPVEIKDLHIYWTGKIDLVISLDNQNWVSDHKTSSIVGPTYWKDFELSQPAIGYCWAGEQLYGTEFRGLLANVIVGRKPTKTGTPTDFQRQRFYYTRNRLQRWERNVTSIITSFVQRLVTDDFPQETKWCVGKYGVCPMHDECSLDTEEMTIRALYSSKFTNNTWSPLAK